MINNFYIAISLYPFFQADWTSSKHGNFFNWPCIWFWSTPIWMEVGSGVNYTQLTFQNLANQCKNSTVGCYESEWSWSQIFYFCTYFQTTICWILRKVSLFSTLSKKFPKNSNNPLNGKYVYIKYQQ